MTKTLQLLFLFFILISFGMTSCQRDNMDGTELETGTEPTRFLVPTSVAGYVRNNTGSALSNAVITIEGEKTVTDADGYYAFESIKLDTFGSVMKIELAGYSVMFLNVIPVRNSLVQMDAMMILVSRIVTGSASGNIVIQDPSFSLLIPASKLLDKDNKPYTGEARIEATIYGLGALADLLPPQVRAQRKNTTAISISHRLGLFVKAVDANNNPLQLKEDEMEVSISNLVQPLRGDEMMFTLDENKSYWKELDLSSNGSGNKANLKAKVNSFYALASVSDKKDFSLLLTSESGNALPRLGYTLVNEWDQEVYRSSSDKSGKINLKLDNTQDFHLELQNPCEPDNKIKYKIWDNGSALLNNIMLTGMTKITYDLHGCDNGPLNSDINILEFEVTGAAENVNYPVLTNQTKGEVSILSCQEDFIVRLINENKVFTHKIVKTQDVNQGVFDLGIIEDCNPPLGGELWVDQQKYIYSKDEFYIVYEITIPGPDLLTIFSNNFAFATKAVEKVGQYQPFEVTVSVPSNIECKDNCNELIIHFNSIGGQGELISAEVSGTLSGRKISGKFTNVRYN